jgi:hypothetical protein
MVNGPSSRHPRMVYPTHFEPLLTLLAATTADTLTLTLVEIEEMIGRPLLDTAYVDQVTWRNDARSYVRAWKAMGWKAWLDCEGHQVTWTRGT